MNKENIWARLATLWKNDVTAFRLLSRGRKGDRRRPLVFLVHPGDAVEDLPEAVAYSASCQRGMGAEILDGLENGYDGAVLHRLSSHCSIGRRGSCLPVYRDAIDKIHEHGAVLYGDMLEAAANWLFVNYHAAHRPFILLAGAWSEPEHGCVAEIARLLEAGGAKVFLSRHCASMPGGDAGHFKTAAGFYDPAVHSFNEISLE